MEQVTNTATVNGLVDDGLSLTRSVAVAGTTVRLIRSCNSIWIFDSERRRFRRTPKEFEHDIIGSDEDWRPYFRVNLSDESSLFVVVLDKDGSRLIQSWRHSEPCSNCGPDGNADDSDGDTTAELRLAQVRAAQRTLH